MRLFILSVTDLSLNSWMCLVAQLCPSLRPMDCSPPGSSAHEDSLGKNTGLGCHFLFQFMNREYSMSYILDWREIQGSIVQLKPYY